MAENVRTWHSRKGMVRGVVVFENETWLHVRLAGDHRLSYGSEALRGRVDEAGSVVRLRKGPSTVEIECEVQR